MKKPSNLLLAVAAVVALGANVAQATIDTVTVTDGASSAGLSGLTFSLPTFNPSLGTLNSVELILTPIIGSFGNSAFNLTSSPVLVPGETEQITGVGSLQNSALGMNATYSTSSGTLTSPPFIAAAGPFVVTDGPALPFSWTTVASSDNVTGGAYTALGSSLSFNTSSQTLEFTSGGGDGAWATGGYGNVGGSLAVEFDYTPAVSAVPEPTTIIAGASMLLPFGASALRILRKKQTA